MLLGAGEMGNHHPLQAPALVYGVSDPAWGCQHGTAGHGVLHVRACLSQCMCSAEGWGRGCWQVVRVFGGCRGCRQQPVTVCVIPAGAGDG